MGFTSLGRLKAGVTVESAANELRTIAAALEREYPEHQQRDHRPGRIGWPIAWSTTSG